MLQTLHANVHLKVKQSQTFKFSFVFPSTLPDGSEYLVGQINPGSLPETNVANNTAASRVFHLETGPSDP